jgi:hypothetical protein
VSDSSMGFANSVKRPGMCSLCQVTKASLASRVEGRAISWGMMGRWREMGKSGVDMVMVIGVGFVGLWGRRGRGGLGLDREKRGGNGEEREKWV